MKKGVLWFSEQEEKIREAIISLAWWRSNILILESGQSLQQKNLIAALTEMGYERTRQHPLMGQFSVRGETIEVFPVNALSSLIVGMRGNTVETLSFSSPALTEQQREQLFAKDLKRSEADELRYLRPGDYITHQDHGIGIFAGFEIVGEKKYYVLHYAAPKGARARPDILMVPEGLEKKLSPYVGFAHPTVHRLGSPVWEKLKRRVKEDVIKMAKELLDLYARREITTRTPYPKDDHMQKEFEHSFEFIETDDQLLALADIKKDLESHRPMDRIVVGDVGFGKTEVALRAAFKVASSGKQVALLCPTTILADQHYQTFKKRCEPFALSIGLLSRFESADSQKQTIRRLAAGTIDILIGTHRILSQDVLFKDLGLLVVDEEQRFGVKQKEKIKKFHTTIDILSLSATPIPRSLYMALSHLRSMSTIYTPPPNRYPIQTEIIPYQKSMLKNTLEQELSRQGQVYFLHNKIQTIEKTKKELVSLVPHARIRIAHSRIPEHQMRNIMHDFSDKKFDILLATTIIENGLDFPNVNTLIVENAANLGLSQAYQIRGRIGRSDIKAKAIMFYNPHRMTENGKKRLEALKEANALGSGFFIAKKDLEIRGAGNLLGREQSGNINKVGFNIYCQMLSETIDSLAGHTHG
jgi:transcription-repair coupling factor (superfamily II helicase)